MTGARVGVNVDNGPRGPDAGAVPVLRQPGAIGPTARAKLAFGLM